MKILYRSIADGKINMDGYALSLGVLMNISMSVYCTAAALAEEKEKNTLRTLMTSSVNGLEFFLGSIIPVIILPSRQKGGRLRCGITFAGDAGVVVE